MELALRFLDEGKTAREIAEILEEKKKKIIVVALVDTLEFKGAAHPNDTVVLEGYITFVGKTSMEVCVKTYVEELNGEKNLINTAYLVMVALDENEKPTPVPPLKLISDEDEYEHIMAEKRYKRRVATLLKSQ